MVILLMGVAGAGKTTVGTLLARDLGWEFADGDDFHSAASVEKMRSGRPLTDADREPWLEQLRAIITGWISERKNGVMACSALKQAYRDRLMVPGVRVVYLRGDAEVLRRRLRERVGHYMSAQMLDSQLTTLEEPEGAIVVDVARAPEEIVRKIRETLGL